MSSLSNPGLEVLRDWRAIPLRKDSEVREIVVNCIGCSLARSPDGNGEVAATEITRCGGVSQTAVRATLLRLERAKVLIADKTYPAGRSGTSPVYFRIATTAVGDAFNEAVLPPPDCPQLKQD